MKHAGRRREEEASIDAGVDADAQGKLFLGATGAVAKGQGCGLPSVCAVR